MISMENFYFTVPKEKMPLFFRKLSMLNSGFGNVQFVVGNTFTSHFGENHIDLYIYLKSDPSKAIHTANRVKDLQDFVTIINENYDKEREKEEWEIEKSLNQSQQGILGRPVIK